MIGIDGEGKWTGEKAFGTECNSDSATGTECNSDSATGTECNSDSATGTECNSGDALTDGREENIGTNSIECTDSDSIIPSSKRRRGTDEPKLNKRAQLIFSPLSHTAGDNFTFLEGPPSLPDTSLFKSRSVVVISSKSALDDDIKTIATSPITPFPPTHKKNNSTQLSYSIFPYYIVAYETNATESDP